MVLGIFNESDYFLKLHFVLNWAHLDAGSKPLPTRCVWASCPRASTSDVNGRRCIDAFYCNTDLASIEHSGIKNFRCYELYINIIQQNCWIIPSELQRTRLKALDCTGKNTLACCDRSSKGDTCNSWVLRYPTTQIISTRKYIEDAWRENFS